LPSLVKLTPTLFPEVHEHLLRKLDPNMPVTRWQATLDGRWHQDDCVGYALIEQGRPVGMLGMLFSEREIGGRTARFCNLHSWYVEPEHRASSLLLMRPALAAREHTLTDLSPSRRVVEISRRLGFETLEQTITMLPWLPWQGGDAAEVLELAPDDPRAARLLSPADLRVFRDHQGIDCRHWLVLDRGEYCYLVSSRLRHPRFGYSYLHHVSRPRLLARHHAAVRTRMLQGGLRCVAVCTRLLDGVRVPFSLTTRTNEKLFRPAGVPAAQVDTLYSELVLLKLPQEFRMVTRMGGALRRLGLRRRGTSDMAWLYGLGMLPPPM